MTKEELFGLLAGVVSFAAFVPYTHSVLREGAKPSAVTWFVWTVVGLVLGSSYFAVGARETLWVAGMSVLGPLLMFILALRYGERSVSALDVGCLGLAVLGLGGWYFSGDPMVAVVASCFVDAVGALPMLRNTWRFPGAESRGGWNLFFLANCLNLAALRSFTFELAFYPTYLFLLSVVMGVLVRRRLRG